MPNSRDDARRAAWSAYWATGGLHSCVGSLDEAYSGAIGTFWQTLFAALPATPLRALDLATGNGAIPRLLWQQRQGRELQIDAVDLAELAPAWHEPAVHTGIRFHAGVDMEALPFAPATFDLVCSQFGFEYARREPALAEALRVLRPDGRLALVMHHADSVLVAVARAELANQALLAAPDGLLACAEQALPWIAMANRGEDPGRFPAALSARSRYNLAARALDQAAAASPAPDLLLQAREQVGRLLASAGQDPAPALQALQQYRQALEAARLRTAELVGHALDAAQVQALIAALRQARPTAAIACEPLAQAEGLLAWGLRLTPA
ncbi:MAG TPA: class I SAM-dependent methyltransferase [Arenimonas sp.]|nr:class I SAM-dependent methyltransferase [Arenimonas sp.]